MRKLMLWSMALLVVLGAISCKKEKPDTEPDDPGRIKLTPKNPFIVEWDYKFYDDIEDFLALNIVVDGEREKIMGGTTQSTWNVASGIIYATGGVGAISKHTGSSDAIDVNLLSTAEYGVKDSTYVYSIRKWNEGEGIMYHGEFEYTVKARPADAIIEMDPIEIKKEGSYAQAEIPVLPIQALYSFHKQYFAKYSFEEVAADVSKVINSGTSVRVTVNDKVVGVPADCYFSYYSGKEHSVLRIQIDRPGTWKMTVYTRFAGVGYNFVFTINVI